MSAPPLAKTRALRKYEADPDAFVPHAGEPAVELASPFGPSIGRSRVTPELVARVNRYANTQVRSHSHEFLVPPEVAGEGGPASLIGQLEAAIARYAELTERASVKSVTIDSIWIVSQYALTPSPVHFHSGDVSGVLYLKSPMVLDEAREAAKTYISNRQAGYINFMAGGKQRFARSLVSFRPEIGDLYIFPAWLLHGAEPFRGEGERRSLAFNAFVDVSD